MRDRSDRKRQVFICYRRDDSAYAATAIHDKLKQELTDAEVFFDVESIPPGKNFRTFLQDAVTRCDVLLVIIGAGWLDLRFEEGPNNAQRRLDDPDDFVRIEIASALGRGIPVIPVLVGGAKMPTESSLPPPLSGLADLQAVEVRSGRDFVRHVEALAGETRKAWAQVEDAATSMPGKVFMCYAHADESIAGAIADIVRAVGLVPLQDLKDLRAGDSWATSLRRLIEEADLFMLLWSSNTARSHYAEAEWKHALSLGRKHFIRPVYYEEPLSPIPPELMHLHFSRVRGLHSGSSSAGRAWE
jgi:hypothetical protein